MSDDRLPTHIWVMAQVRQCFIDGIPAYVLHTGEASGGAVLLKINHYEKGCRVLSQMRDLDGKLIWYAAHDEEFITETDADLYIERAVGRDPDLWVVEVETKDGGHPFEET